MITLNQIGADVEVFVTSRDREIVPVIGLVGGTKHNPRIVLSPGFALQEDNVMAEFNIPPSSDPETFSKNITKVLNYLKHDLKIKGYGVAIKSSHRFIPEMLYHPQALSIGCEPDYNAWSGEQQNPADNPELETLRSCGGHVHISFDEVNEENQIKLVRLLDFHLGIPSIVIDRDKSRRILYGKAGSFRPKDYGVEYRTLSNFWIKTKKLHSFIFNGVVRAFNDLENGHMPDLDIRQIIDSANLKYALSVCKEYGLAPEVIHK